MRRSAIPALSFILILLIASNARAADPASIEDRIDRSLTIASQFLIDAQSPDGAWRSHRYGLLKDGPSLTPHVALGVRRLTMYDARAAATAARALAYLDGLLDAGHQLKADVDLVYPTYTAAGACRLTAILAEDSNSATAASWLAILRGHQLNESLEWRVEDLEYGGWSYALQRPHRPPAGRQRGPWDWSNLSATVDALQTLHALRVPLDDAAIRAALVFVRRCQNLADDGSVADPKFDDGGFFFSPAESLRNKAGVAGRDARTGRERYRSYGSATVDGIRALQLCGVPPDDPRIVAGRRWLEAHFTADHNPGDFVAANQDIRDATYFYYCRGVSQLDMSPQQARELVEAILARQKEDGSWVNRFTDGREDDALVGTPLATDALLNCRQRIKVER